MNRQFSVSTIGGCRALVSLGKVGGKEDMQPPILAHNLSFGELNYQPHLNSYALPVVCPGLQPPYSLDWG